jgi:hypothetical protein
MNDKHNFIPRHGSPLFYPHDPEGGFQGSGGGLSRRRFLKRTGGATASAFFAWHLSSSQLRGDEGKDDQESKKTKDVPVSAHVYRISKQRQRKVRKTGTSQEHWRNEGGPDPVSLAVYTNDGNSPPPDERAAPAGYPKKIGWVEDINDITTKCKTTFPVAPGETTTYSPSASGKNSGSNDGDGSPGDGYEWTAQIRVKIRKDKVPYSMKYRFSE